MATDPENGPTQFPHFDNGDVKIIITGSRQYHLHSATLKDVSPVLKEMLDKTDGAPLSKAAIKKGVTERWRLVATVNPNPGTDNSPEIGLILTPIKVDSEGKPERREAIGLDLENGRIVDPHVTVSCFQRRRKSVSC